MGRRPILEITHTQEVEVNTSFSLRSSQFFWLGIGGNRFPSRWHERLSMVIFSLVGVEPVKTFFFNRPVDLCALKSGTSDVLNHSPRNCTVIYQRCSITDNWLFIERKLETLVFESGILYKRINSNWSCYYLFLPENVLAVRGAYQTKIVCHFTDSVYAFDDI